jgi:hypothetical protein
VGVVGLRAAELVVGHTGPEGAVAEVLQLAAAAPVADQDVELPVGTERDHPAVVVAALGLPDVLLQRADPDELLRERQRGTVPDEPVNPVAQQRGLAEHVGVLARAALGPVEIDAGVLRKVRVQGDAKQPALRPEVHRQVQDRGLDLSAHDAPHLAGVLLQHEEVVGSQERQACRGDQAVRQRPHRQPRIQHRRPLDLRASDAAEAHHQHGRKGHHEHRGAGGPPLAGHRNHPLSEGGAAATSRCAPPRWSPRSCPHR